MTMQQQIRAVYADPQIDGMEEVYQAIGSELIEGSAFDEAYARVMERGAPQPKPGSGSAFNAPRDCRNHLQKQSSSPD